MPFTIPKETFLYSVAAYGAVHALLFTLKPEIPTMDSFGEDAAKNNKPVKVMTAVMGSMFGVLATASFVLAEARFMLSGARTEGISRQDSGGALAR